MGILPRVSMCVLLTVILLPGRTESAEEHIRGMLEKTAHPSACAQITDALNDVYYVVKSVESEKMCGPLIGQRVVLTGTVEERGEERAYFITVKQAEVYQAGTGGRPNGTSSSLPLPPPVERKKGE